MSLKAPPPTSLEGLRAGLRLFSAPGEIFCSFNVVMMLKSSGFFIGSIESAGNARGFAGGEADCAGPLGLKDSGTFCRVEGAIGADGERKVELLWDGRGNRGSPRLCGIPG